MSQSQASADVTSLSGYVVDDADMISLFMADVTAPTGDTFASTALTLNLPAPVSSAVDDFIVV